MRTRLVRASVFTSLVLIDASISAQRVGLGELKAAYVLNFTRFTEWPSAAPAPRAIVLSS
jgi:hypothetical protein